MADKKLKKSICISICFFIAVSINCEENIHISPMGALKNENIPDIPPLKIEGFLLGMLEKNFIHLLNKKARLSDIKKIVLRPRYPKITSYIITQGRTENYTFHVYDNILAKIFIISLRTFEMPENIIKRFSLRYGNGNEISGSSPEIPRERGYYWKKIIWNRVYRYIPPFSRMLLDVKIQISLDLTMKDRLIRRVIYGYCYNDDFLMDLFIPPSYQ